MYDVSCLISFHSRDYSQVFKIFISLIFILGKFVLTPIVCNSNKSIVESKWMLGCLFRYDSEVKLHNNEY